MAKAKTTPRRKLTDPTALGRRFKSALRSNSVLLGGLVHEYLRASLVKMYKQAGFDFIFIENEHTTFLGPEFSDFVQCARDNGLPVISKVGQVDRAEVTRVLDSGVAAIQLPRTESRSQLETLLDLMKYPPQGSRAGAPFFGNVDYVSPEDDRAWLKKANQSTSLVAHIESVAGFENAEEIVSTPNLDAVYVGPYDSSIAMGAPGQYDHPRLKKAMHHVLTCCLEHKVAFGTTTSGPRSAAQWISSPEPSKSGSCSRVTSQREANRKLLSGVNCR